MSGMNDADERIEYEIEDILKGSYHSKSNRLLEQTVLIKKIVSTLSLHDDDDDDDFTHNNGKKMDKATVNGEVK